MICTAYDDLFAVLAARGDVELEMALDIPLVDNPELTEDAAIREQLVSCNCGKEYRVMVNGTIPIPDVEMMGVNCPFCSSPASDAWRVSGHSGDIFNTSVTKL